MRERVVVRGAWSVAGMFGGRLSYVVDAATWACLRQGEPARAGRAGVKAEVTAGPRARDRRASKRKRRRGQAASKRKRRRARQARDTQLRACVGRRRAYAWQRPARRPARLEPTAGTGRATCASPPERRERPQPA